MKSTQNTNLNEEIRKKFYSSLKFPIRLYRLFGCVPFVFSDFGIQRSVFMYSLSGIQAALILVAFLIATKRLRLEGDEKDLDIHALLNLFISSFCLIVIWIDAGITVAKWSTLLKNLLAVDRGFIKYKVEFEYCLSKKQLIILAGQLALPTIIFVLLEKNVDYLVTIGKYTIPHCTIIVTGYVYCEMINLIKERFKELNKLLKVLTNSDSLQIVTIINNDKNVKSFELLCQICTWHHNLIKSMSLLNDTFGFRMVSLFVYCFVRLALHVFLVSRYFKTELNICHLCEYMMVLICDAITVSRICQLCEFTVKEAKRASSLIHQINTVDQDVIDEIEMFSLQIMNEDIEFSAFGFFQINYNLLLSMIGGVTTYTIILIQLQLEGDQSGMQSSTDSMITTVNMTVLG